MLLKNSAHTVDANLQKHSNSAFSARSLLSSAIASSDEDLQAIVDEINDTPMKVLDWETPNEVWYREFGKVMSKTSHPKTSVALTN